MSYDEEVIFLDDDSKITTAIKTVNLWVGTSELAPRLKKLGISYTKNVRGLNTYYILTGKDIGKISIKL